MRLSKKAFTVVTSLLWGAGVLFVCLVHLAHPAYGRAFLEGISSVYPGFHGGSNLTDTLVGTGYALLDGAIGGFVLAWLYNRVASA